MNSMFDVQLPKQDIWLAEISVWIDQTKEKLGFTGDIKFTFSDRFVTKLGEASVSYKGENTVRFSSMLWERATIEERRETVIHEVCHIVNIHRGGHDRSGSHGRHWKQLMIQCGVEPKRCHDVKVGTAVLFCACLVHSVSTNRHTRVVNGKSFYRCRKCGYVLSPKPYK